LECQEDPGRGIAAIDIEEFLPCNEQNALNEARVTHRVGDRLFLSSVNRGSWLVIMANPGPK